MLRIAFDLDGVLADMDGELVRRAEILFGGAIARRSVEDDTSTDSSHDDSIFSATEASVEAEGTNSAESVRPEAPAARLQLTARQERRLWHDIERSENFWETLSEIEPGSIARLAALADQGRWEIIFLTKRPASAGATSQVQTQRWLEAKGFKLPSVYVVRGSRGRIAAALALDFVIDDRPENCLDVVVDSKARAILVWRQDESQLPGAARRLGIGVVKSIGECLAILQQADATAPEKPKVIDRVMRLLGLKEPAHVL